MTYEIKPKNITQARVLIMPFVLLVLGLWAYAMVFAVPHLLDAHEMRGFVPTTVILEHLEFEEVYIGSGRSGGRVEYRGHVRYRLSVGGQQFEGSRFGPAGLTVEYNQALAIRQSFEDGRPVAAYVDPDDPTRSAMFIGSVGRTASGMSLVTGGAILVLALLLWVDRSFVRKFRGEMELEAESASRVERSGDSAHKPIHAATSRGS